MTAILQTTRPILKLGVVYALLALLWSVFGLASPVEMIRHYEYQPLDFLLEATFHPLFGVLAVALTLNPTLIILCALETVLIDVDHLLNLVNYPTHATPAHSLVFALIAALVLGYAAKGKQKINAGVFYVTLSAVMAHIGYDIFASQGGSFPIFSPLSFTNIPFPSVTWIIFEAAAVATAFLGRSATKSQTRPRPNG